eukprot:6078634-Amphidinium_carterae.1
MLRRKTMLVTQDEDARQVRVTNRSHAMMRASSLPPRLEALAMRRRFCRGDTSSNSVEDARSKSPCTAGGSCSRLDD